MSVRNRKRTPTDPGHGTRLSGQPHQYGGPNLGPHESDPDDDIEPRDTVESPQLKQWSKQQINRSQNDKEKGSGPKENPETGNPMFLNGWSLSQVVTVIGVLAALQMVGLLGITWYINNNKAELESRIKQLERKILIDKEIDKLVNKIDVLEEKSSGLTSNVDEMDEKVKRLQPNVEQLEKKFEKWEPKVDQLGKTVGELEPKVGDLNSLVVKWEPNVKEMNVSMEEMKPKVKVLVETVRTLEPKVTDIGGIVWKLEPKAMELDKTVGILEPKVQKMDETVKKLTPIVTKMDGNVKEMEPKVNELVETVEKLEPKVTKVDGIVEKLEPRVEKMDETVGNLEPKVNKMDDIVKKLEPTVTKMDVIVKKLEPKVKVLVETVQTLEPKVKDMDDTVKELKPKVEELVRNVDKLEEKVKKLGEKVSVTETMVEDHKEMKQDLHNLGQYSWKNLGESILRIDTLEMNSRSLHYLMVFLFLWIACQTFWTLYSYSLHNRKNVLVSQHYETESESRATTLPVQKYRPVRSVLDNIQPTTLTSQICVISFYSETKALHMRLVDSVCSGQLSNVLRVPSHVSNHENIPMLPRAKIFLVFVDFNERDIILEHPDREIGDLRMTTVQGARKMGGDVFVVYVKDVGSQNLTLGQLYNERLTSITAHPELSVLNGKQRVLTTYNEFTKYQRSHLASCFTKTLRI